MEKNNLSILAGRLADRLRSIDYQRLPISNYNKGYIARVKPAIGYYMQIYADCLQKGIAAVGLTPEVITMVDFGGGSGFLSMLAKEAGIGQVVYIDLNPLSVVAAGVLKVEAGIGADIILEGSSAELAAWFKSRHTQPQLLIATDLIEHVYDLRPFFTDLLGINDRIQMLFTTGSTPFNPYVQHKLRRTMQTSEEGTPINSGYLAMRRQYIRAQAPHFSVKETETWSLHTRGLTYEDIDKALSAATLPQPEDSFNTCDPATGNWTERILPLQAYTDLLAPLGHVVRIDKGFYNAERNNWLAGCVCKVLNLLIRKSGKTGLFLAPYILLSTRKQ